VPRIFAAPYQVFLTAIQLILIDAKMLLSTFHIDIISITALFYPRPVSSYFVFLPAQCVKGKVCF